MNERNLLKNCLAILCVTSLLIPTTVGSKGESANSLQPKIIPISTTQKESGDGLQNSSWPMFHHDNRHTGRSPYGTNGNWYDVKWKFQMEGFTISSPAIDKNDTIYIGEDGIHNSYFYAINPNGTEKWHFDPGDWVESSPALSSDGTIYFGTLSGNLFALHPNGSLKWSTHIGAGWAYSSPVIDNNGTIYIASVGSSRLCAVNPNGTIKWSFYAQDSIYCDPAIGNDGTIYIGSNDGYMYAIYSNGTLKWKFYAGGQDGPASATIGDDGSIIFGGTSGELFALYSNGTLHWKIGIGWISSTPAINKNGTIYIGDQDNYRIYSIAPNGSINWYYKTDGEIISSPAIDKNGIIYCGSMDGNLYALNPNGTLRWKIDAGDSIESSTAIGENGAIYIAAQFLPSGGQDFRSYLYTLQIITEQPPIIPIIRGPTSGKANQNYNYTVVSTDPEGNNVSYYVDWGDGTNTGWIGPVNSGYELTVNHTWTKQGTYTIKVKAMDNYSAESDWGTLQVTMPLSYEPPHFWFFEWLFERFPHVFPILRHIFGY